MTVDDLILTEVQVFMTRRNSLQTIHEPFGDAFYYGPERMGSRFEDDEEARKESGFANSTFKTILDRIDSEADEVRSIDDLYPTSSTNLLLGQACFHQGHHILHCPAAGAAITSRSISPRIAQAWRWHRRAGEREW